MTIIDFARARISRFPGQPTSPAAKIIGAAAWSAERRRQVAAAVERAESLTADRLARAAMALDALSADGSYATSVLAPWFGKVADRFGDGADAGLPGAIERLVVAGLFEALVDAGETEAEIDVGTLAEFVRDTIGVAIDGSAVPGILRRWRLDVADLGDGVLGVMLPADVACV